jgi:hypothetical protein
MKNEMLYILIFIIKMNKPIPNSQRNISISKQEPYTEVNPNDNQYNDKIRGNNLSLKNQNKELLIGFKEIDEAIFYYIKNIIKPHVIQNGKLQEVPLIYDSSEKWKQIQKDGYYRDANGKILLPLMVVKKNNIINNKKLTNKLDANMPNNYYISEKKYSVSNIYTQFNILNNIKPKYEYTYTVVPDYVTVNYSFIILTYYVEQMNKIIESINYTSDSYWGDPERFKFKASINSFNNQLGAINNDNERIAKSSFDLKVEGYIVSDNIQKQLKSIKKAYSNIQVIFSNEIISNT